MRSFYDAQQERWQIDLTVADLLALKAELGLDLLDKPESIPDNLSALVDVLSVLLTPQIEAKGLDANGFARRLNGDVLNKAMDCFMEELTDFFTHLQRSRGLALKGLWEKAKEMEDLQAEMVTQALGKLSSDWLASQVSTHSHSKGG